ncbi:hypothetical protein [Adhaeribacter pallidiroseus]|uniref:Uncharacterized protein n=1 Tax=Adhaeribacter pallidiroseus TaxID=2072847 RepID=A0A369QKB0_9BACT|nr:hypothetical protein [Adhaeribacter pallidiroseus]RDC62698.1 hypothetical protein AHMF7616_01292 [Adhaeribacter pallidiroseus]
MLQSAKVYLLVFVLMAQSLGLMAQKPPTGGPNPKPPPPPPIGLIIAATGVALGGAGLYTFKLRGPKIPVGDYLPNYLLRHDILPSPDAIQLMHQLNPKLNRTNVIRTKTKLKNPDLPEISQEQLNSSLSTGQTTTIPTELKEQISLYKSSLKTFRNAKKSIKKSNISLDSIYAVLTKIEQVITPHEKSKEEISVIKAQLVKDLFGVLNKTLSRNIATKIIGDSDSRVMKEILESLTELILPDLNQKLTPPKSSQLNRMDLPAKENSWYALVDSSTVLFANKTFQPNAVSSSLVSPLDVNTVSEVYNLPIPNMEQGFAFAVYKINAAGETITKGPEVEGQYSVHYALPALRSFTNAYHECAPGRATYAYASLPPAKYFFEVRDNKGKVVALQNPLIDTKDAFRASRITGEKKIIKIIIRVSP